VSHVVRQAVGSLPSDLCHVEQGSVPFSSYGQQTAPSDCRHVFLCRPWIWVVRSWTRGTVLDIDLGRLILGTWHSPGCRYTTRNQPRGRHWMAQIYVLECATCPTSDDSDIRPGTCHVPTTGWLRSTAWSAPRVQHRRAQMCGQECATCPPLDGPDRRPGKRHVFSFGGPRSTACTETRVDNRTAGLTDRTTKMVRNLVPRGTNPTARILRPGERHVALNPTVQQEISLFFQTLQRFYCSKRKTTSSHCEQGHSCSVHEKVPARWLREKVRI
jgi:hypothetical protein